MTEAKMKSDSKATTKKKPSNAPKQIADRTAKKAKEGVKKAATKTRESVAQAASPNTDADESPQRYAENRIEESTEYAADRLKSKIKKPELNHKRHDSPEEDHTSSTHNEGEKDRLSANNADYCQKSNAPKARTEAQTDTKPQEGDNLKGRSTPSEHPSSKEPIERPEPQQPDSLRDLRQPKGAEQNPQTAQYQRKVSAEKIVKEKKDARQEPSRDLDKNAKMQLREQEPLRNGTEKPLKGDADESPKNPKIKEYQVQKAQNQLRDPKAPRTRADQSTANVREADVKDDRQIRSGANEPVNPQMKDYQVRKLREKPEIRTIKEPASDVKELSRKEPTDRIRDVSSRTEIKEAPTEPVTVQSQQRQLAMDKYRDAVKERRESEHAREYRAEEPTPSDATAHGTQQAHYSEAKAPRTAERPNAGSESMHFHADAHTPRGLRSGRSIKEAEKGVANAEKSAKGAVKTADKSIKTAEKSVKTSQQTIKTSVKTTEKTAEATAKTAKATAKTAQKTAQATAKTTQKAAKAAQAGAKATAKATKTAAQVISNVVKWIVAAIKELIAAIIAGGWVSVIVIAVVAIVSFILCLCFGVFSSNEASSETGRPMTAAIQEINGEFTDSINAKISRYKRQYKPDHVELVYEGDTGSDGGSVMNWADVLGIYAVSTTTDPENPTDVLIVTDDKINTLREIFNRMNSVSYDVEIETEEVPAVDEHGNPIYDDDGEQVMDEEKTLTITITVSSMGYREAAQVYGFDDNQNEMLREMMRPEYYPLFAELTGDIIGDGGEYGFGLDINPDLPPSELGYQIVQAAKRYIGRSYASMDCSKLARTAYADVGLTSMNGLSSVRMAQKCQEMGCLFTDPSQLQAGDLIFFARFDPSKGKDYCGDVNRCGTGKCRRWLHIHHVAIYINETYLIDSTGGDNSVQIRKHWGINTAKWKWVCFGRPTT